MPWCPKCKMEYREGIEICSDCKIELVSELPEEMEFIPFFQADDKKVADKLVKYFEYSQLKSSVSFDEENKVYIVSIPSEKEKQAKKLYQAFYFVEWEKLEKNESALAASSVDEGNFEQELSNNDVVIDNVADEATTDAIQEFNDNFSVYENNSSEDDKTMEADLSNRDDAEQGRKESNAAYVMKSDQYKDLASTIWTFLILGIAGFVVVILNIIDVLHFLNGPLPIVVMGALFLFFIYVGLSTIKKAKKVKSEIKEENERTEQINEWLKQNVTEHFLASLRDESISEELNYIKQSEDIKKLLIKEFGELNTSYLDRLIEEFYDSNFDGNE